MMGSDRDTYLELVPRFRLRSRRRRHKRIEYSQRWKPREVSIRSPQSLDLMIDADGRDSRVMHTATGGKRVLRDRAQRCRMRRRLADQHNRRRSQPDVDLIERLIQRAWRVEHARVSHDGQKLMHARPRNRPLACSLGQILDARSGPFMPCRIATVGVHQNVRVHRDHPPRPS